MSQPRTRARARSEPPVPFRREVDAVREDEVDGIRNGRYRVQWQVYDDDWNEWMDYVPSHNTRIEAAFQQDALQLDIGNEEERRDTWHINLVSLPQKNLHTERVRPIQRVLITHS